MWLDICTGSDSGHAWIYEKASSNCNTVSSPLSQFLTDYKFTTSSKKSGSVVSLIKADTMTCNGIQVRRTTGESS